MLGLLVILAWIGLALGLAAVIWIAVIGFQNEEYLFAIGSFFCFPVAIIYGIMRFDEAKIPLFMLIAATILRVVVAVGSAGLQ